MRLILPGKEHKSHPTRPTIGKNPVQEEQSKEQQQSSTLRKKPVTVVSNGSNCKVTGWVFFLKIRLSQKQDLTKT